MFFSKREPEKIILFVLALSSVLIVLFIVGFMLKESFPIFSIWKEFFTGMQWNPSEGEFGIVPILISTFFVGGGAVLISALIGIPAAIYLAEYSPKKLRNILKPSINMLVGIPSVVLGFFGLMVIVPFIRNSFGSNGESMLAGWVILAIMTLPHVISMSEDAIRAVPKKYREASLSLGASKWQTIKRVVLPNAKSGIFASLALGIGTAIGETMAVLMVIGNPNVPGIPESVLEPVRVLTSTIVIEIPYSVWGSMHQHALFGMGIVLFFVVAIFNVGTKNIIKKRNQKNEKK